MFAAAVIIAHLADVAPSSITILAVIFIILRVLYGICYILDKPSLRSTVWFGGFFFTHNPLTRARKKSVTELLQHPV